MRSPMPPRVSTEWFIVREVDTELLVYDLRNQRVTALNPFAAGVWRACDGEADAAAIARILTDDGIAVADLRAVELALDMLTKAGLVEFPPQQAAAKGNDRRDFMRKLFSGGAVATAAAIATPAVVTILAPTPAQAGSSVCGYCEAPTPYCFEGEDYCVQCLDSAECGEGQVCTEFECITI